MSTVNFYFFKSFSIQLEPPLGPGSESPSKLLGFHLQAAAVAARRRAQLQTPKGLVQLQSLGL
jgi:hypothetical protein